MLRDADLDNEPGDRERALFDRAMELPESEWTSFLDEHCADEDPDLRQRLKRLLDAHRSLDGRLTGTVAPDWAPDEIPERIGPYVVRGRLGEGGMGIVYDAEQTEPIQRRVALKVIKPGMDSRQVLARFESERQTLAMLDHPGVAHVLDAGNTVQGLPYFVMEYVDGQEIDTYCDGRRLDIDGRLELFMRLCDAIQYAHTKGILHRDLKPSNVLVSDRSGRPEPKVIDFGIAKALTPDGRGATGITELGQMIGTPEFMSPEQAQGRQVDTRSDVYSLGVILYELLTGTPPIEAGSPGSPMPELQRRICETQPLRPSRRWSDGSDTSTRASRRGSDARRLGRRLSGDLDAIVMKALEKDPEVRYSSPAALRNDIERYRSSLPILAQPLSATYQIRKLVARNKLAAAFVASVLVLVLAFAGTMSVQARRIAAERERAEDEAAAATAINEFLQNTLESANPWGGGSRETTVREALDDAVGEIDEAFDDRPAVAADVRLSIGSTYVSLGDYEKGAGLLREALEIRRALSAGDSPEIVELLAQLAYAFKVAGDYEPAERYARDALEMQERISPELDEEIASRRIELAGVLGSRGKFDEAEPLARDALELLRSLPGDHHAQTATALEGLGGILWENGDAEAAEPLVEEAYGIYREHTPEHLEWISTSLTTLGLIRLRLKDLVGAEETLEQALGLMREMYGDEHPQIAIGLENLANIYYRTDRLDDTIDRLQQVLEMRRRHLGDDNQAVARTFANLASVYRKMERLDEAEDHARQSLTRMRKSLRPEHPLILVVLNLLKGVLIDKGDTAGAMEILRETLQAQEATLPADDAALAATRRELAELGGG